MSLSVYPHQNIYQSTKNTSTTPLSSGATFTGDADKIDYPQVGVVIKTDNSGTLFFDFSPDGTNWDSTYPVDGFIIRENVSGFHTAVKLGRFFRVRLVNDTGAQTTLNLYTYFGSGFIPSVSPLNQQLSLDQDAIVTRPTITQDEIVLGRFYGVSSWNKFGYRTNLTSSGGEETVWAASGNFTPLTSAETFDIAYDGTSGGSTDGDGTSGALELTFYYIDDNGLPAIAVHTLGTDGSDTTSFSGLGINRCVVSSSGSSNFNVSDITVTATTAGTTQAFMPAEQSVTQQLIFFCGSNHKAVVKDGVFNVNKLSGSNPKVTIKGYIFNRAIETRFEIYRHTIDTQSENTIPIQDVVGFRMNPTDILYFVADTDQNNTIITGRFSLNEYQLS